MTIKTKLKFYSGKTVEPSKSTCILTISVGQMSHEGERLTSTLNVIKQHFLKCYVIICDTLQRFNLEMMDGLSKKTALQKSQKLGQEWVKRNFELFNSSQLNYKFLWWADWLKHPKFTENYEFVLQQYYTNPIFRMTMEETISEFYNRKKLLVPSISFAKLYQFSLEYLLEECAVQKK